MSKLVIWRLKDSSDYFKVGLLKKDKFFGGHKVTDVESGADWAATEVEIQKQLSRFKLSVDAVKNGGATIWSCIVHEIEYNIWVIKLKFNN